MNLDDKIWATLEGGYKIPYDASISLRLLEETSDPTVIENIFSDFWENLHHQGDVGLASYLSVPQLVRLCIDKKSLDWNFVGLCLVIEDCRQRGDNPKIPTEYQDLYLNSLKTLEQYLLTNFNDIQDPTTLRLSLALFATLHGQPNLGRAILNLDEGIIDEFLEQF